ncbi:metal-dependent hydrolase [Limnospira sp. PMC 289.06]|uniref:metal-dependent hydrolase n=1 Tax=Limnospira sp. PMC 289.06 TaxID=2981094 RepID=UPI0028E12071|nr:metal-dependent hydrolase [Limnospira sp. PMC 289.06]
MMSLTHAAIAAGVVGLGLGTNDPLTMGLAIIGSQLPDIDTTQSTIGGIFFPISEFLEKRYPHRTITHSLLATAFVAIASYPLIYWGLVSFKPWIALALGHLVAIFSDTFTKQGVQLFWPMPVWCVFGSNPRRRLTTGGTGEYWVLAGAVALCVLNWQVATGGGLRPVVSQFIGMTGETISHVNSVASERQVFVSLSGRMKESKEVVNGQEFLVIDSSPTNLVLFDIENQSTVSTSDIEIQTIRVSRKGNRWRRHQVELSLIDEPLKVVSSPPLTFVVGKVDIEGEKIDLNYSLLGQVNGIDMTGDIKVIAYE